MQKPPQERPTRADALRNRERVLAVARKLFEQHGAAVEITDVARRAGVGVGTIYRHFATKDALIEAVLASHIQRLVDTANTYGEASDAGAAFFGFIEVLAREFLSRGTLHEAAAKAAGTLQAASDERDALRSSFAKLLSRAQAARAVRGDVTATDVILLVRGSVFPGVDLSERVRRRLLDVVCKGLRA